MQRVEAFGLHEGKLSVDCGGHASVAGTRVRVVDVLNGLAAGDTIDEIVADFPYLTRPDILACIAYGARAVDHAVVQVA